MKFISWNVNGLRACVGKGFAEAVNALDPDFLCLQETKLQAGQIDHPLPGYMDFWNYAEKKGYSGTAIFAKTQPLSVRYGVGVPELDTEFFPIGRFNRAFLETAKHPLSVAVERADGRVACVHTRIHNTPEMRTADCYYIDRLVKTLLWMKGGFRIYTDSAEMYAYLQEQYSTGGGRDFDRDFMANVYEHPFEVVLTDRVPESCDAPKAMGGHLDGCRIGFDAGGSDRKVSAVLDGKTVYSEEVVWFPKTNSDPA